MIFAFRVACEDGVLKEKGACTSIIQTGETNKIIKKKHCSKGLNEKWKGHKPFQWPAF